MKALFLSIALVLSADAGLNHGQATKGVYHILASSLGSFGTSVADWVWH